MFSENDLILCEDGHCLIYKRKVHHRGPAFDNPNEFSMQRGANQDLDAYITKGDYDRTRPQEKGSTSGLESKDLSFISETYVMPRINKTVISGPNVRPLGPVLARPGAGQNVGRPPSTSEIENATRTTSTSEMEKSNKK